MAKMSRSKGARGELELAALLSEITGLDITRRCRRHGGDDDLLGLPGWSIEVKRHADYTRADLARWWRQAEQQSGNGERPVLFVRRDRDEWRAIWVYTGNPLLYASTIEAAPEVWATMEGLTPRG